MTAPPALSVAALWIRRGPRVLVRELSFEHAAGAVAWIVGENGAGKSSLLRVLAGRLKPSAGTVTARAPATAAARRAYYHPDMHLPARITFRDWLRLIEPLTGRGAQPGEGVLPALERDRVLGTLSTGEAKRLLLDALLRTVTPFTILDEPYEHLSAAAKETLTEELRVRARTSVVIVATNQEVPVLARGSLVIRLDEAQAVFEALERSAP